MSNIFIAYIIYLGYHVYKCPGYLFALLIHHTQMDFQSFYLSLFIQQNSSAQQWHHSASGRCCSALFFIFFPIAINFVVRQTTTVAVFSSDKYVPTVVKWLLHARMLTVTENYIKKLNLTTSWVCATFIHQTQRWKLVSNGFQNKGKIHTRYWTKGGILLYHLIVMFIIVENSWKQV